MLSEFDEEHALLTANPHWTGPRGNVREIDLTFLPHSSDMIDRWVAGDFDVLTVWNLRIADAPDTELDLIPDLHTRYIGFSADRPPFSNELVRKAVSHAVNRERLLRPEDSERAATRGGAIPPAMPGHSHRVGPDYDLEVARKFLADAGYPEGRGLPELKMLVPPWLALTGEFLTEQLAELGIRLAVESAVGRGLVVGLVGRPRGEAG